MIQSVHIENPEMYEKRGFSIEIFYLPSYDLECFLIRDTFDMFPILSLPGDT